jgi:membrane-associated phospholipid phosphatase
LYIDPTDLVQWISSSRSGDDLFFSAHTGLPFLMAIIFWRNKLLKYFFLACTLIGGTAVILGHLHYSIDVFSALFIAFGIFHISKFFFPKDYRLFQNNLQ